MTRRMWIVVIVAGLAFGMLALLVFNANCDARRDCIEEAQ